MSQGRSEHFYISLYAEHLSYVPVNAVSFHESSVVCSCDYYSALFVSNHGETHYKTQVSCWEFHQTNKSCNRSVCKFHQKYLDSYIQAKPYVFKIVQVTWNQFNCQQKETSTKVRHANWVRRISLLISQETDISNIYSYGQKTLKFCSHQI